MAGGQSGQRSRLEIRRRIREGPQSQRRAVERYRRPTIGGNCGSTEALGRTCKVQDEHARRNPEFQTLGAEALNVGHQRGTRWIGLGGITYLGPPVRFASNLVVRVQFLWHSGAT